MGNPAGVKRDFDALEQRRLRAARLLAKGLSEAEVARQVGVHRQSVNRWKQQLEDGGQKQLKKAGRAGRKPLLSDDDRKRIVEHLKQGPEALGYSTGLWTAKRVADLIERECGVRYTSGHVWWLLGQLGWSCQRPKGRALERDEAAIRRWKQKRWPELKKNAEILKQTIVFVDESGLSERPHRCRTWAPRGQTPVLQHHFNWKMLSVAAGITLFNFYFRLYKGAIRSPQVVDFLSHLLRHIPGRLLVIWDGLPQHRSKLVQAFTAAHSVRLTLERLPAYAPELNPTEYIFGHLKHHELPNFCAKNITELSHYARRALARMRRRPRLVRAFWAQAKLF